MCDVLTLPAPGLGFRGETLTRSRAEELLPCRVAPDGHVIIPVSPAHVALLDVAEIHCVVTYLIHHICIVTFPSEHESSG